MKNQTEITFNLNGKRSKSLYPITVPTKLTSKQKAALDLSIQNQISDLKFHFNKDGAWNISVDTYVSYVLNDMFGCFLDEYIELELKRRLAGVALVYNGTNNIFENETDRVFYNRKTNKIRVAKRAKDVNNEINIGRL